MKNLQLDPPNSEIFQSNFLLPYFNSRHAPQEFNKTQFKSKTDQKIPAFITASDSKHRKINSIHSDHDQLSETPNPKNIKEKLKHFKELQEENLRKIKSDLAQSQKKLYIKTEKMMEDHIKREKSLEELQRIRARDKEEIFQKKLEEIQFRKMVNEASFEEDINEKLSCFENKIKKSEEIHKEALQEKVKKSLKFKEKSDKAQKKLQKLNKLNEVEVVQKLVDKHENVKLMKEKIDEKIQQLAQMKREKFDKQRLEALEKIRKAELEFIRKSRSVEVNIINVQKVVSERKAKLMVDMNWRKELKRLKDIECLIKIKREKKKLEARNLKSLRKTLQKFQKIDEFRQERDKIHEQIFFNRFNKSSPGLKETPKLQAKTQTSLQFNLNPSNSG